MNASVAQSQGRRRARSERRWKPRAGVTLVEVVVAALVFAVGVLGAQAAVTVAFRQARDASMRQRAAALAGTQLERLANARCADPAAGSVRMRGVTIEWRTGAAVGPHARAVEQTVRYRTAQRLQIDTFHAAVRCR